MASKYSIVQYVPDPITDERINIGVIAFDDAQTRVSFLKRWDRVHAFAREDIDFLKEFAHEMELAALAREQIPGLQPDAVLTPDRVKEMCKGWVNSIQITEPKASLASIEQTLTDAALRYLVTRTSLERGYKTRTDAAVIGRASLRDALRQRLGREDAEKYLQTEKRIQGKRKPHTFDNVLMNGTPYAVMQGISFELPEARQLDTTTDALSWSISDVHEFDANLPIGIIALPPFPQTRKNIRDLYEQSVEIFRDLGADVLNPKTVDAWANRVVEKIPPHEK